jgi:hypothetical protein
MLLRVLLLSSLVLPAAAHASSRVSLLAGETLRVAPSFGLLAQADAPPPVGASAAEAPAPSAHLVPEEEPPSLGAVLGFMISGGAAMGTGAILSLYGLALLVAGTATNDLNGTQGAGTALNVAGLVVLILGLSVAGVGVFLFIHGNALRHRRNEYNEAHGISNGPDAPPHAPLSPPSALAWNF